MYIYVSKVLSIITSRYHQRYPMAKLAIEAFGDSKGETIPTWLPHMGSHRGVGGCSWNMCIKSNYERMLSHDCKASFGSLQFLFATFLQLTSFWGPGILSWHIFSWFWRPKMPRPWILPRPNLASQPKMLLKCHRIQPAGSRHWNPLLGALLGAVWQRRLSCSFDGFPTESQTHVAHAVWNSRPLLSSCSLSFREGFPEIAWKTSDLFVFEWILFLFLILVSDPLVRFSIFFIAFCCLLVCIVISALWSSHSWPLRAHDMNDSEGFYGVPALRDDHFSSWASIRKLRFVWHLNRLALRNTILRQARPCGRFLLLKVWFSKWLVL